MFLRLLRNITDDAYIAKNQFSEATPYMNLGLGEENLNLAKSR